MLSEETDNPGDSVPPLIDRGPYRVISVRSNIVCPAKGLEGVLTNASKPFSFAPQSSQEAPA